MALARASCSGDSNRIKIVRANSDTSGPVRECFGCTPAATVCATAEREFCATAAGRHCATAAGQLCPGRVGTGCGALCTWPSRQRSHSQRCRSRCEWPGFKQRAQTWCPLLHFVSPPFASLHPSRLKPKQIGSRSSVSMCSPTSSLGLGSLSSRLRGRPGLEAFPEEAFPPKALLPPEPLPPPLESNLELRLLMAFQTDDRSEFPSDFLSWREGSGTFGSCASICCIFCESSAFSQNGSRG